jgi:hypothetical protein
MILETFYMIRAGNFGLNYAVKVYMTIFGLVLCIIDSQMHHRKDYWWVFFWGTLIWGGIELIMQLSGTRVTEPVYLYDIELPVYAAAILRGTSEGATIAVFGLFFGDRFLRKDSRTHAIATYSLIIGFILILAFLQALPVKIIDVNSPSRRDIFTPMAVITLFSFLALDLVWLKRTSIESRKRALSMFGVMIIFAAIWTFAEFLANTRWIEMGIPPNYEFAPPIMQFVVLAWDVIVEIGFCYLPYLILPYVMKRINDIEKRTLMVKDKSYKS